MVAVPKYSQIPHSVVFDNTISPGARLLYAGLQAHWWKTGECMASHATLAAAFDVSERQIQRYLSELVAAKHIIERHHGRGRAKAYGPAKPSQHDRSVVLGDDQHDNPTDLSALAVFNPTDLSPSEDGNPTDLSCQPDRFVAPNPTDLSPIYRPEHVDPPEDIDSGGSVAAVAAPVPPAESTTPKKRQVRSKTPSPEETPAPETVELTDQSYATALSWGFDHATVDFQLQRFLERARAKGWTYVDWKAGFRTWLLNEVEYAKRDGRSVGQPPRTAGRRNGSAHQPSTRTVNPALAAYDEG